MLNALTDEGGFSEADRERADWVLRDPRTDEAFPIDLELLNVVYRIQRHFAAHSLRVISSYRTPSGKRTSRHGQGKALDIIVPGQTDKAVAEFAQTLGFCGVGLYTNSGFVHVDVRPDSHFWVDSSGPGQRARPRAIAKQRAQKSDRMAVEAGRQRPRDSGTESQSAGSAGAEL
jgi:hypothetical protein